MNESKKSEMITMNKIKKIQLVFEASSNTNYEGTKQNLFHF